MDFDTFAREYDGEVGPFDPYPDGEDEAPRDLEREALEREAEAREQAADDAEAAQYDD